MSTSTVSFANRYFVRISLRKRLKDSSKFYVGWRDCRQKVSLSPNNLSYPLGGVSFVYRLYDFIFTNILKYCCIIVFPSCSLVLMNVGW